MSHLPRDVSLAPRFVYLHQNSQFFFKQNRATGMREKVEHTRIFYAQTLTSTRP